ncbi:MAG: DUF2147 domain-containing protein [Reyranellaceae bacterium]
MRIPALAALAAFLVLPAQAQTQTGADVLGKWQTESTNAHVELYRCADPARGAVCGKVVWLRNATNPDQTPAASVEEVRDVKNPEESLRSRKILGLEFLYGFKPAESETGTYEGGKIYNAEDGETYSARIKLENPDTLVLRGYVLMPLLGKSQTWSRVK